MNILNILIILFIAGMAYWWSTQGLFSSMLHMVAVIVAGALAFAVWEVLAVDLFMGLSPLYAWPAGLLAPFLVFLLVIRLGLDKTIKGNVHFSTLINSIGGAFFGLISGVLTAGILLLALFFLPLGPSFLGYQPLVVTDKGGIDGQPGDSLLVPVDKQVAGFYSMLADGAFSSHRPMHVYQPQLALQAQLYRMSYDPNSSPAASPEKVSITAYLTSPTPVRTVDDSVRNLLGDKAQQSGHQLVLVETQWQQLAGMFDGDSTLRVSPTQIRLAVTDREGQTHLVAPVGASQPGMGEYRRYISFGDNKSFVWGDGQQVSLAFAFVVPAGDRPRFLMVRHARLPLPEQTTGQPEDSLLVAGLADGAASPATAEGGSTTGAGGSVAGQKVMGVTIDASLPAVISKNMVQGFVYEGSGIVSGQGTARRMNTQATKDVLLDSIHTPDHRRTLRTQLDRESAGSIFGAARVSAAQLGAIWLEDSSGEKWYPVGYVLHKGNGDQKIKVDLGAPVRSARELPLGEIEPGDTFYLYFSVARNTTIASYHVGSQSTPLNLMVPR